MTALKNHSLVDTDLRTRGFESTLENETFLARKRRKIEKCVGMARDHGKYLIWGQIMIWMDSG